MEPLNLAKSVLRRTGMYNRLKASALYDVYARVVDERIVADREAQLRFYVALLHGIRPGDLVFDIGANQGVKTDIFLRMGARVVAADPDEANEAVLRQKFLQLRMRPRPVVVIRKAVSDSEGVNTMWIDEPGSTMNTLSSKWVDTLRHDETRFGSALHFRQTQQIATTTLDRLMAIYGRPYFVKIDVEGFEPVVLRGMNRPVPYLSFEVNLPEFRSEGLECLERLENISSRGTFNYTPDCRYGLALPEWLPIGEFAPVLDTRTESSIDVIWRSGR